MPKGPKGQKRPADGDRATPSKVMRIATAKPQTTCRTMARTQPPRRLAAGAGSAQVSFLANNARRLQRRQPCHAGAADLRGVSSTPIVLIDVRIRTYRSQLKRSLPSRWSWIGIPGSAKIAALFISFRSTSKVPSTRVLFCGPTTRILI